VKLTAKARAKLPKKAFAGPKIKGKPSFPVEDHSHARAALSMLPRAIKAGHVTEAEAAHIRRDAHAELRMK
jgi:hypothetical protein